ncbi:MAG TPA: hypothetical protein VHT52_05205 [Stellaceae bacterium]|jgi:hypothetical protein|nr:hypothetical protein [Stellaceae bacterium]
MPLALLLNPGDPMFAFEHDQQTRALLAAAGQGYAYVLDPVYDSQYPATMWHQDHQHSHNDFNAGLRIRQNEILIDSDLANTDSLTWWTFVNHQEHYNANSVL